LRKGYPQRVDNSRCQQQLSLSSFDVRSGDKIDRMENNEVFVNHGITRFADCVRL